MQGREGVRAEAPAQEVVLCPGLAARAASLPSLPGALGGLGLCLSLRWGEPFHFPSCLCSGPSSQPLAFFDLCLNKLLGYSDIFEIQPLEASGHSSSPIPAPPYPTLLDSTLF